MWCLCLFVQPEAEEEEDRYVPDMVLKELKNQIDEIEKAREERKKKWCPGVSALVMNIHETSSKCVHSALIGIIVAPRVSGGVAH